MKVAILTSEAVPFAKTGGLADVTTALGKQLAKSGHEVILMLPLYSGIHINSGQIMSSLRFQFGGREVLYSIVEANYEGMRLVLINQPHYFQRSGIYGDSSGGYGDNDERYIFFTRACIDYFVRKNEKPDIFHCNDWPTALTGLYLRTHYFREPISQTPVLFTIHNAAYQGVFGKERYSLLDVGWEFFTVNGLEFYDSINFMKGGIAFSDVLSTVSRRYSQEIQTPEYGCQLDHAFRSHSDRLFGILNGIDDDVWNPETDPHIAASYSYNYLGGKQACRRELLTSAGFYADSTWPIVGIISRLAAQKGFDLLEQIGERLMSMDLFLMILGSGESRYEQFFERLRARFPNQVAVAIKFDNALSHKIEAGADMFLMPSHYEPCGLNQMYSLRYGTVPVVRATGGLDDTVQEWDWNSESGNGFKFYNYNAEDFLSAVGRARTLFENKPAWNTLMRAGMRGDYSWRRAAEQYVQLYHLAIQLKS